MDQLTHMFSRARPIDSLDLEPLHIDVCFLVYTRSLKCNPVWQLKHIYLKSGPTYN